MKRYVKRFLIKNMLDPLYLFLRLASIVKYDKYSKTYLRNIMGNKIHLNPLDFGLSRQLAKNGIREKESVMALFRYLHPDMNVLDIGANIGFYVLLEAKILSKGKGKIIAIEPEPNNFELLKKNITTNKYGVIVNLINGAVYKHNGYVNMLLSEAYNSHRVLSDNLNIKSERIIKVPAFTFLDILSITGLSVGQINFIRMDIEGAEYLILPDIINAIRNKEKLIMFIEFHPNKNNIKDHTEILKELDKLGYRCLSVTKEYIKKNKIIRQHFQNLLISDLYTNDILLKEGGLEVFLAKL